MRYPGNGMSLNMNHIYTQTEGNFMQCFQCTPFGHTPLGASGSGWAETPYVDQAGHKLKELVCLPSSGIKGVCHHHQAENR